jgi:hypothetical protein
MRTQLGGAGYLTPPGCGAEGRRKEANMRVPETGARSGKVSPRGLENRDPNMKKKSQDGLLNTAI